MNNPRLWIVVLALVSFLAGLAAGLMGSERTRRGVVDHRGPGDFERRFTQVFDLDPEGQKLLAELLAAYNSQVESIELDNETRRAAEAHTQIEQSLLEVGTELRENVRDLLLVTEAQRTRFDRLMTYHVENL